MSDLNVKEFDKVVEPVIKYLAENHHPHMTVIIDGTRAELLEGKRGFTCEKYIRD